MSNITSICDCTFCNQYVTRKKQNRWTTIGKQYGQLTDVLFESRSIIVVAGLGAISAGYVLILPKSHYYCVGQMRKIEIQNLTLIKDQIKSVVQKIFGSAIMVEHGMNGQNHAGGCIDHAHIHIVPSNQDFRPFFSEDLCEKKLSHLSDLQDLYRNGSPYLFYEDNNGVLSAYPIEKKLPSQYFRRIWSGITGKPDQWDWELFPEYEKMAETISQMQQAIQNDWKEFSKLQDL
jgi:diadenosine tetraphosphate (Ap4A) HIT family hydrolase